jgi:hypothetical protein
MYRKAFMTPKKRAEVLHTLLRMGRKKVTHGRAENAKGEKTHTKRSGHSIEKPSKF